MLLIFVAILTVFVFSTNVLMGRNITQSFLLGVTVALGITPEVMPIIISISISAASLKLSKFGVLIRRLSSLEDLGNVDIICTDKTGTITNGLLKLNKFVDLNGKEDIQILQMASICNANHPSAHDVLFPNPIDNEIWQNSINVGINDEIIKYQLQDIKDFDFESRIMQVTAIEKSNTITIIKGATENIVNKITNNESEKALIIGKAYEYEKLGNRVLSIASKNERATTYTFHGFILLRDTPKTGLEETLESFKKLNVDIKIITGDSPIITREICKEAGLIIDENQVITGIELEKMSTDELYIAVEKMRIFARVSPEQKSTIISALQHNQHVICYIGDGVNDIGAIRTADVGISVDSANDVTKNSSDIVLLQKDLSVLSIGITEGRKTFDNTMKFILNTMSSSFGNVLTIAIFSLFLKFMPFLPIQVLLIDSLSDLQHITISTDNVDGYQIKKPQTWDIKKFIKFMLFFGVIGTLVDFIHVIVFQSLYTDPDYFRTVWFVESILTELLAIFIIRTKLPFYKSRPSRPVVITTVMTILIGLILPFTLIGNNLFKLVPIDLSTFGILSLLVLFYLVILEYSKRFFYRHNE
jgi:Mg2+-importing ATPase